jgi:hypothetical protein
MRQTVTQLSVNGLCRGGREPISLATNYPPSSIENREWGPPGTANEADFSCRALSEQQAIVYSPIEAVVSARLFLPGKQADEPAGAAQSCWLHA